MPNEFTVVGEHLEDESELLVLGADGRYYEYDHGREQFVPTEPGDQWALFPEADEIARENVDGGE
jgi:hypothetical protein